MSPAQITASLVLTGTPQNTGTGTLTGNIGPMPNLNQALSSFLSDNTPPSAASLRGALVKNKPVLSWSGASDNVAIKEYWIYRNGAFLTSISGNNFTDNAASRRTRYTYFVITVDTSGNKSVSSNTISVTTK